MTNRARWRRLRPELRNAWPAVVAVAGIVAAVAIGLRAGDTPADRLAIAGLWLQWGGLAIVAWGFRSLRQRFNQRGWFQRVIDAWCAPARVEVEVSDSLTISAPEVSATVRVGRPPVEQRLLMLETEVDQLRSELRLKVRELKDDAEAAVRREARRRASDVQALRDLLRDVSTDGIHLEGVGLVWLFVGVLFGTVPAPLSRLLGLE